MTTLSIIVLAIYGFGLIGHIALGAYAGAEFIEAVMVASVWPLYLPYALVRVLSQ